MTDTPVRNCREWNWQSKFATLEDATDFLLNHLADLAPYAKEVIRRSEKKEKIIKELNRENISLKHKLKEVITNENKNREK